MCGRDSQIKKNSQRDSNLRSIAPEYSILRIRPYLAVAYKPFIAVLMTNPKWALFAVS